VSPLLFTISTMLSLTLFSPPPLPNFLFHPRCSTVKKHPAKIPTRNEFKWKLIFSNSWMFNSHDMKQNGLYA
jgi:hypothetical protein